MRTLLLPPPRLRAFGLCALILVVLANARLWDATLWAEDGVIFLPETLELGLASLFKPNFGFYQLAPHLLFYGLLAFPLRYFAFLLTASCVALYAWTLSKFTSVEYRWLVRSDQVRLGLCLVACFMPGLHEVLGNAANLHTVLLMYLALLAWKDLDTPLSWAEVGFAFICGGSEGACIVLLPVFAYRVWYAYQKHPGHLLREGILFTVLAAWSLANYITAHSVDGAGAFELVQLSPGHMLVSTARLMVERLTVFLLLGPGFIRSARHHDAWRVAALGVPMLALLVTLLLRKYRGKTVFVLAVPVCVLGSYVVTWLVRPYALEAMLAHVPLGRYGLASGPFALALWLSGLEVAGKWRNIFAWALVILCVTVNWPFRVKGAAGKEGDWRGASAMLQDALDSPQPRSVVIPINPTGWNIIYTSKPRD